MFHFGGSHRLRSFVCFADILDYCVLSLHRCHVGMAGRTQQGYMAVSSLIHQPCLNFLLAFSSTLLLNHRLVEYAHFNGHADQPIIWIHVQKMSCEQEPG